MHKSVFILLASLLASTVMAETTLSGTANYGDKATLPNNAVLEISLQDVSLADAPAKLVNRAVIVAPGQSPVQFKLRFDPKSIDAKHTYSLNARITADSKLLFTTDSRNLVKANGSDGPQTLKLVQVADGGVQTIPLQDSYWKLVEMNGKPLPTAKSRNEPFLQFNSEGRRLAGSTGCNRLIGGYTLVGGGIHFTSLATTRMACTEGGDLEQPFLDTLGKVKRWRLQANKLSLFDSKKQLLMAFEAGTAPKQ
ncbi:META domain-containing protein [Chitinimonas sp. PSY-7]|uniref:META domain-containing protein n=1 Tax=Chitinimonas sp. PSY-7 TaxID=3459088 RepID=UPI00403FE84C